MIKFVSYIFIAIAKNILVSYTTYVSRQYVIVKCGPNTLLKVTLISIYSTCWSFVKQVWRNYSPTESSQLDFNYFLSISKRICAERFFSLFFKILSQKYAEVRNRLYWILCSVCNFCWMININYYLKIQ